MNFIKIIFVVLVNFLFFFELIKFILHLRTVYTSLFLVISGLAFRLTPLFLVISGLTFIIIFY